MFVFFLTYMFTLIYVYIVWYFITLLFIYFYLFLFKFSNVTTKLSFSRFWGLLTSYHNLSWIFKFFVLQISGLPPFFFFFLKFILLEQIIVKTTYILFLLTFVNFLLGMFFYIKIFFTTDYSTSDEGLKQLSTRTFSYNKSCLYVNRLYSFTFYSILIISISCLSFFFLGDMSGLFVNFLK